MATRFEMAHSQNESRRIVRCDDCQTLLCDADDTLWENNIYFERAITAFISYLDHRVHTREEVREHLNICERVTVAKYGYGLKSFQRSLTDCFEHLSDGPLTTEKNACITSFVDSIASQEIELIDGVEETLHSLSAKHRLILVSKGNPEEQVGKLDRSGLRKYFAGVEVLPEKTSDMYRDVVARHACDPPNTWMIGNSPRSDINPAMAAGLNTVFVPHSFTWVLEHETVDPPQPETHLIELSKFSQLLEHF